MSVAIGEANKPLDFPAGFLASVYLLILGWSKCNEEIPPAKSGTRYWCR
jgi:hypothetical protein